MKLEDLLFGKTADRITKIAVIAAAIYVVSLVVAIVLTR